MLCGDSAIQKFQKIVELPQVLFMDEVPYADKIFGVPVAMQHQVPTDTVRRTTDACDSDVKNAKHQSSRQSKRRHRFPRVGSSIEW